MAFRVSYFLLAAFLFPSLAIASEESPVDIPLQVIDSYVKSYNVSKDEAVKRLEIMSNSDLVMNKLIDKFGDDLIAGVFYEHKNDFKIVVRTTKKGQKSRDVLAFANNELPELNIEVIPNSPRNFRAIENIINNQAQVIDRKVTGFQSLGYEPKTDKIIVSIYDPNAKSGDELTSKYKLDKVSGMDAEVQLLAKPLSPSALVGGGKITGCTAGFSGFGADRATPGIITAYHCTVNETVKDFSFTDQKGVNHSLKLAPQNSSANHDMAFLAAPKGTSINPGVYLGGSSEPVKIVAAGRRSSLTPGSSFLCHYGKITGFSCGEVSSITVKVASVLKSSAGADIQVCKTTQPYCNPTFITITDPNLACQSGDSGGPVISGYTAYGITSSCNLTQMAQGATPVLYLSSLDFIGELPAYLGVSPS